MLRLVKCHWAFLVRKENTWPFSAPWTKNVLVVVTLDGGLDGQLDGGDVAVVFDVVDVDIVVVHGDQLFEIVSPLLINFHQPSFLFFFLLNSSSSGDGLVVRHGQTNPMRQEKITQQSTTTTKTAASDNVNTTINNNNKCNGKNNDERKWTMLNMTRSTRLWPAQLR